MKPDSGVDQDTSNPQSWNLYSYVRGNPVNMNDPTGQIVNLSQLSDEDNTTLLNSLNEYSGNEYGRNDQGQLELLSVGANSSQTATDFINAAIGVSNEYTVMASNNDPNIFQGKTWTKGSVDKKTGETHSAGDIKIDFADYGKIDFKGLNPATNGPGATLAHELGHNFGLEDPPSGDDVGKIPGGTTVANDNQVRKERGLATREKYSAVPSGWGGKTAKLPFKDPSGKLVWITWPNN